MKLARKSNKSLGARHLLLPAVSTIAALVAGVVHAQQVPAAAAKPEASDKLETITVTATKRSEPLQSVPIAITVLGGEQLEQSNLNTLGAITTQCRGTPARFWDRCGRPDRRDRPCPPAPRLRRVNPSKASVRDACGR